MNMKWDLEESALEKVKAVDLADKAFVYKFYIYYLLFIIIKDAFSALISVLFNRLMTFPL